MIKLPQASLLCLLSASALAQTAPSLTSTTAGYTLSVPYLEYGAGSSKQAYSASLTSTTLTRFQLLGTSVSSVSLISGASNAATFAATTTPSGAGFRLTLPYIEVASGGTTKAYTAALTTLDLANFSVDASSVREVTLHTTLAAPTAVSLSEVSTQTVGSASFGASSQLKATWTAPTGYTVDHYEITATDALMATSVTTNASASATSATLTTLKAATSYAVVVKACQDSACVGAGSAAAVSATTPGEYWQLQGSGHAVATLTKPVADGNARLSATRFGAEAGATANTVQFYYGPMGVTGQSVASSGVVAAANPASYLSNFTSYANTSGVRSPTSVVSGIKDIMTGQGVPLGAAMGGPKVRLFFESNDVDGKTRIYSVDSVDGYVGRDFNLGSPTTCSTSADYTSSSACLASLVLGVAGDTLNPTPKISAARQNKIAWPTLTDWRWNGEVGTFMVFTIDRVSGCTTASHNHGYAVWNGSNFVAQLDSSGCPKAFKSAQAALPMHIGDVRYKMYFGDPSITAGKISASGLPFVGPKKLIFADARSSGDATIVDYEDWESVANARNVVFLWPDGTQLDDTAEGYIDDFHFLTPTGSIDIQVLYLSITDGSVAPFAATAVLLNP